jgi:hypothetical protein
MVLVGDCDGGDYCLVGYKIQNKKVKNMKKTAAAVLGMAAILAGGTGLNSSAQIATPQEVQQRPNDKQTPIDTPAPVTIKKLNPFSGYDYGKGEGIQPKIYGMFYVKRGTHKKTNIELKKS